MIDDAFEILPCSRSLLISSAVFIASFLVIRTFPASETVHMPRAASLLSEESYFRCPWIRKVKKVSKAVCRFGRLL